MTEYGLPHILRPLLVENRIDGSIDQELFDAVIDEQAAVRRSLDPLGLDLIIDTHWNVAVARNKSEDALEEMARTSGLAPIEPTFTTSRLSYWESCALVFFRKQLDQEISQGGKENWFRHDHLLSILAKDYPRSALTDNVRFEERINRILGKLERLGLICSRAVGAKDKAWRGTAFMAVALSVDHLREFETLTREALDGPEEADETDGILPPAFAETETE